MFAHTKKIKISTIDVSRSPLNQLEPTYPMRDETVVMAAAEGALDVLKAAFERGERCDLPNFWWHTPLFMAVFKGHIDIITFLLDKNTNLGSFFQTGEEWVYLAEKLQRPLSQKMQTFMGDKSPKEKVGLTLYEIAEIFEFKEIKAQLLEAQCLQDARYCAPDAFTPIKDLLTHPKAIELLRKDDSLSMLMKRKKEPLHQALCSLIEDISLQYLRPQEEEQALNQMDSFIGLLLNNPELCAFEEVQLFSQALMNPRINEVMEALKQGDLKAVEPFYRIKNLLPAPLEKKLQEAIQNGSITAILSLFQQGMNFNQVIPELGLCPIHLAALKGKLELLQLLHRHNADFNKENSHGDTPLLMAVFGGKNEIVSYLLSLNTALKPSTHSVRDWIAMTTNCNIQYCRQMRKYLNGKNPLEAVTLSPRDIASIFGFEELKELLLFKEGVLSQNNMFSSSKTPPLEISQINDLTY